MIAVAIPSFQSVDEAFTWLEEQGHRDVVRVVLFRGPDGLVRGNALVRAKRA